MLQIKWSALMALLGCGCTHNMAVEDSEDNGYEIMADGAGGGEPVLTLPFSSGEYWLVTQTYTQGSHVDYGFTYGDDSYAIDFTQSGCDAYGKSVTPVADGTVLEVGTAGSSKDHGYGNTVLIDHGGGYVSRYGHLSQIYVSEGQWLSKNDVLGAVGNTGYVVGTACSDYPGTHLHLAFYHDGEGIKPEPLSEIDPVEEGCWINREGEQDCESDPGPYDPVEDENSDEQSSENGQETYDIDDEGDLGVAFAAVYPSSGTQEQTEFLWVAIIDSPSQRPSVTLKITNPNDDVTYDFDMETDSTENPYVFTYQKTLRDASPNYEFWVEASNGDGNDDSQSYRLQVDEDVYDVPSLGSFLISPTSGEAGETEFEWGTHAYSGSEPSVNLYILNPNDLTVYEFPMNVDERDNYWKATYEKTLRDAAVYTYWFTVQNDDSANSSSVWSIEAE